VTTFYLLSQPTTLRTLKSELEAAIPTPADIGTMPLPTLEALPYLSAIIMEGLRLTYGVSCRLARSDPDNPMIFKACSGPDAGKEWVIPTNTPVGMTNVQLHHNERIFPSSQTFDPSRFLGPEGKAREKYMVSFCGGSRQCVGINLAQGELYLLLSAMWRVWGSKEVRRKDDVGVLELWETGLGDVEIEADAFLPIQQKGTKGIRLKVFGVE